MPQLTLNKVKSLIKAKRGVTWEAGETSVSHLSVQSKPGMAYFGVGATEEELTAVRDTMMAVQPKPKAKTAARIDWRNFKGANYVTGVRNQLNCGSCVAFATCAALESPIETSPT